MNGSPPDWVKDAIFYQIFPDRFARSDRVAKPTNLEPWDTPPTKHGFKGGDLLGVAEHLNYLARLGVTAIYLNPIFRSAANHRYHTHDYYQVDPILGGNAGFQELLDRAHDQSMRIVLDGVFNHASRGFYQFQQTLENGIDSPYLDWFHFDLDRLASGQGLTAYPGKPRASRFDGREAALEELGYRAWYQLPALPKFNTDTQAVRTFIFDVARHWMAFGADGWRLDVPSEVDDDAFWREFRRTVKDANPEAYLVGEIWHGADRWLQGDQFDGVMNYVFNRACLGFFGGESLDATHHPGGYPLERLTATQFADRIDELLGRYPEHVTQAQFNLLSSHDMPRFLTLARRDKAALKLATLFQMTFPGVPSIYYGDEVGMEGGPDPDCRRSFPWDEDTWDHDLLAFFQRAVRLRREHRVLRRGAFVRLEADDAHEVYAFGRRLRDRAGESDAAAVILNSGTRPYKCDLPAEGLFHDGIGLRDLWGDVAAQVSDQRIRGGQLEAGQGAVLTT